MDPDVSPRAYAISLFALIFGALAVGFSPIFVRFADAGPATTGFWRLFLASPAFLLLWTWRSGGGQVGRSLRAIRMPLVVGGLFFATDMWMWNASVELSTVAKATLLACLAPIFVALYAVVVLRQRLRWPLALGLVIAIAGTVLLVMPELDFGVGLGEALGLGAGICYAAYIIAVAAERSHRTTLEVMAVTSLASAGALFFPAASEGALVPSGGHTWASLFALALLCHVAGQGLIAYALANLPVVIGSLGLLLQPVSAAILAWILFGESMTAVEGAGAVLIILALVLVNSFRAAAASGQNGSAAK